MVSGSVVLGEQPDRVLIGMPVQQLDNLLREATPGDILLSREVHAELGDSLERAGVELAATPGVLVTQPLYVLSSDVAERVLGPVTTQQRYTSVTDMPVQATLSQLSPGSVLGDRFELLSVLGSGGMGVVYKARDRELNDLVALKTLKRDAWNDRESLERLKSEIKLARRITHPNVLRTFDFGEVAGVAYISMEYVRGLTLRYLLEQTGRLPYSAALRLARQLCAGLEAAHAGGVLHRDIKPENLIIDNSGNAKLMDFGIARPIRRSAAGQTEPGSIVGTPHYLAPEQIEGREVDHRADIYACGIVFYEMFTGKLPFAGDSPMQIVLAHLREEPVTPSVYWPEIPPPLEQLILRAIARQAQDRYPSVGSLLAALNALRA